MAKSRWDTPSEVISKRSENSSNFGGISLVKSLLGQPSLTITGDHLLLKAGQIGYLDQRYENLDFNLSVFDSLKIVQPTWSIKEIRHKLNEFLFKKNDEVFKEVSVLSGGEKARLSLCLISTLSPKLLILDEVTNNLDIEAKEHVINIIKVYPGSLLIISHDQDFIDEITFSKTMKIENKSLIEI